MPESRAVGLLEVKAVKPIRPELDQLDLISPHQSVDYQLNTEPCVGGVAKGNLLNRVRHLSD